MSHAVVLVSANTSMVVYIKSQENTVFVPLAYLLVKQVQAWMKFHLVEVIARVIPDMIADQLN